MSLVTHGKKDEVIMDEDKNLIVDSITTEFNSTLQIFISPYKALTTWSLKPITSAIKNSFEQSKKLEERHALPEHKR